jgi:hypothetical protein
MSDAVLEFIRSIQQVHQEKSYSYVYFDIETSKIEKISNKNDEVENLKYIKVLTENIDDIFTGKKRIEDYRVFYNLQKDSYELTFLDDEIIIPQISDKIYQIIKVSKSQIYSFDVTIRQNVPDKMWDIFLNEKIKHITKKLFFSITAKNDPNILYRTILIDTDIEGICTSVPFMFEQENDTTNISVYTNKILKNYAYEITNE